MSGMTRALVLGALLVVFTCGAACGGGPEPAPPPPPAPAPIPAPADVAAPPASAERTASGIASVVLKPGTGTIHPTPTSTVVVHYTGWTPNGEMFDSSVQRGEPSEFRLDGVIEGWTEGLQLMVFGEKRRFWIPGALAYDSSTDPSRPKGMLVFDIELIDIK
jgi:peptidylprolyl isomerase